jgi:DNA repair exonuclease SbcCD nuclease subunit
VNSIKILHTADIHIGAAHSYLGAAAEKRRYETLVTFENIIDLATENNVDIIAIAGDLFDTDSPEFAFTDAVFNKIAAIPNIKVIYAAGNHDPLNSNSPFKAQGLPQNLYVLPPQDSQIVFEDIKTRVYGRSFETAHLKGEEVFSLQVPNDDYLNIMVQHGELRSDLNSDYNAITPAFVKKSGMDYIALGHVHKHTPIGKIDNVSFAYCGCPEGQGFDELDDKGVYLGTVSKGKCDLEFISVSKRKHIHEKVDIGGVSDIASHVLTLLQNKYESFSENLYKIELTGQIPEDTNLNLAELTARLSNQLYFVKLKDSTEYTVDYEALAKETSLKGVFVKNMLEKIEQDPENKALKQALKLGLKAFSSEVKYNED